MVNIQILSITCFLAGVSQMSEALPTKGDEKLDNFLLHLVQSFGPGNRDISDPCTAVIFGMLDWQSSKFPIMRLGLGENIGAHPDVSMCYFVILAPGANSQAPDEAVLKFVAASKRNPAIIVRILLDTNATDQETRNSTSMARTTSSHLRSMTTGMKFPIVYLRLSTLGFVLTRHCRKPRSGIWLSTGQISYKNPDQPSSCDIRIGFNDVQEKFHLKADNTPDMTTEEGLLLQTFLDTHGVKGTFQNGNSSWGNLDPETGKWNGLVGMALYGKVELSVGYISYRYERATVIDYSHYIQATPLYYISKYPGLENPVGNLAKVFDGYSWLLVMASCILIWSLIYNVAKLSEMSGNVPDLMEISMHHNPLVVTDLGWFKRMKTKKTTIAILLLTLNLAAFVLPKAFGCNLNAILLKSETYKPVDNHCDIVEQKKTVFFMATSWRKSYLETSSDPCQIEVAKTGKDFHPNMEMIDMFFKVATDSNAIFIGTKEILLGYTRSDPRYQALPRPWFHISREVFQSYYQGWVLPENSIWKEAIDKHVLRCHQAGLLIKLARMFQEGFDERQNSVKPLMLEHFVVGYLGLLIGSTIALAVFIKERMTGTSRKSTANTTEEITSVSPSAY